MNKEVNELLDKLGQMEEAPLIWINKKLYTIVEQKEKTIKEYNKLASHLYKEQDLRIKLQEKIDKAIEYINDNVAVYAFNNKDLPHWEFNDDDIKDLLEILKGEYNHEN